ncbi:MAG: CapA family protein [Candidatus Promineifilaceae bacterium]
MSRLQPPSLARYLLAGVLLLVACRPAAGLPAPDVGGPPAAFTPPPTPPIFGPGQPDAAALSPAQAGQPATPTLNPGLPSATPWPSPRPPTAAPSRTPSPRPGVGVGLAAGAGVPAELRQALIDFAAGQPDMYGWEAAEAPRQVRLTAGRGQPLANWLYVVAAPFATLQDAMSLDEVRAGWAQGANGAGRLVLDEESAAAFGALWGPAAASAWIVSPAELPSALWAARPAWTLYPFERLQPDLKVLSVDGASPLAADFRPEAWPLWLPVGLEGDPGAVARLEAAWPGPAANYDPAGLTRVAMTGVTALGRATAYQMEVQGITAPGVAVAPAMQAADIAHVSHEVAFAPDCPYPNPIGDPIFCARDGYLELLRSLGTDVVELTGNHVNDWGTANLAHTIELYEAAGMRTFGGGRNLEEAGRPALFEHNGNRIAFVGCNPVGPAYAWATAGSAGSRPCDYAAFQAQIGELSAQGYLVIATLQYGEFYHYAPTPQQAADFGALASAGAAAVSGSQGHHAQGFAFEDGAFIHYGLGNLFFDQMQMLGTRQSFIDVYTVYQGRLIHVELVTSLIENYCCPRTMTAAERGQLLLSVFSASGW